MPGIDDIPYLDNRISALEYKEAKEIEDIESGKVPYVGANRSVVLGNNSISTKVGVVTPKIYPTIDSTTAVQINKANGTTNVLNVDTTNTRVGIGSTSPTHALEVTADSGGYNTAVSLQSDIGGGIAITGDAAGTDSRVGLILRGSDKIGGGLAVSRVNPGADWQTYMAFYTNDGLGGVDVTEIQEKMRLLGNGNLGIGIQFPEAKLAINGGVHVGGTADPGDNNLLVDGTTTLESASILKHITTPSNPSAGYIKTYVKNDDELYKLTSAGVETKVGSGAGGGSGLSTVFAFIGS